MEKKKEKTECCICFDEYVNPKLLTCKHTFCLNCISKLKPTYEKCICICCPLCRSETNVPNNDLNSLMTNFFVSCKEVVPVTNPLKNIVVECENEPFSLPQTDFRSKMLSVSKTLSKGLQSFFVFKDLWHKPMGKYEQNCEITCLSSCSDNSCLVVYDHSEQFLNINGKGEIVLVEELPESIVHIERNHKRKLFVAHHNMCGYLKKLKGNYKLKSIIPIITMDKKIINCCHYSKGKIAVLLKFDTKHQLYSKLHSAMNVEELSILVIHQPSGNIKHGPLNYCNNPVGMAVSSKSQLIFVSCDRGIILVEETEKHFEIRDFTNPDYVNFKPGNMCSDPQGNIFVVENTSKCIILLDPVGVFLGIVFGNYGIPQSITCTMDGYLWVGDSKNGIVSKHLLVGYENLLS